MKRLLEMAKNAILAKRLEVGFFAESQYPDGTSVPLVAASNEFGTKHIPARPFFRTMVIKQSKEWPKELSKLLKKNDYNTDQALTLMGERVAGELVEAIAEFEGVPLSPKTIAKKGFDKQLIDTRKMIESVTFKVRSRL